MCIYVCAPCFRFELIHELPFQILLRRGWVWVGCIYIHICDEDFFFFEGERGRKCAGSILLRASFSWTENLLLFHDLRGHYTCNIVSSFYANPPLTSAYIYIFVYGNIHLNFNIDEISRLFCPISPPAISSLYPSFYSVKID